MDKVFIFFRHPGFRDFNPGILSVIHKEIAGQANKFGGFRRRGVFIGDVFQVLVKFSHLP
jgi:hypothetical protein